MSTPKERAPIPPDRLSRVLGLLHYLLDPERPEQVPLADITRDLGMTPREIREDLDLLNLVNHGGGTYLIYASIEHGVVTVSRETLSEAYTRPARLSPLLAKALRLALDLLGETLAGAGLASLASVREKLGEALELEEAGDVEVVDTVPADTQVLANLREAVAQRRVIRIEYYTASRDALSCRDVEPYYLVHGGPGWYLEGYCREARAPRTFRLDRIRSVSRTAETFEPRRDIPLEPFPTRPENWNRQPGRARVAFPADRRPFLEEEGLRVEDLPPEDGTPQRVVVELPYTDEGWLVREILRYAGEAELLEPKDLRARVADEAEFLRRSYGSA